MKANEKKMEVGEEHRTGAKCANSSSVPDTFAAE